MTGLMNSCVLQTAVIVMLLCATLSSSNPGKSSSCCTRVSRKFVKDTIVSYDYQPKAIPCVEAVIFHTQDKMYCSHPEAKWVKQKTEELDKLNTQNTTKNPIRVLRALGYKSKML